MSNIFYSQVDNAVQLELNARGNSGKNRTTNDINFMVGKIANVQLTAYKSGSADPNDVIPGLGTLGGSTVRSGRYLPSSPNEGFLTNPTYPVQTIEQDEYGNYKYKDPAPKLTDYSRRIGPIITAVSIDIGDHSMGLLNKATVNMTIPNPTRDLDTFEEIWLYPGRYVKIDIEHPNSAIITGAETNLISTSSLFGSLSEEVIDTKLKKLYPSLATRLSEFKREIRKLNKFSFQGLITSFDFSYTTEGSVDVTISLTGTSNTYTDVTMLMNPETKKNETKTFAVYNTVATASVAQLQAVGLETGSGSTEFYGQIFKRFEELLTKFKENKQITKDQDPSILIPFTIAEGLEVGSDHFMLYGKLYPNIQTPPFPVRTFVADTSSAVDITVQRASFQQQQDEARSTYNSQWESYVATQRYITLGALVQCINYYITPKLDGSVQQFEIKCTDEFQYSNYYPQLTSCIPKDILLLPNNENLRFTFTNEQPNVYGTLKMYPDVLKTMSTFTTQGNQWTGIFGTPKDSNLNVIFPSRIFINLEYIQTVLNTLSEKNTKQFTLASFLANISARIAYATGNAIVLKLVTDPDISDQLLFSDTKFLKPINTKNVVTEYSVPMLANHPNGTIVREFTFQAKLPSNVKNLSYVLNSGTDVSDDEIAPYLNFMYNSKDPVSLNKAREKYKNKYEQNIKNLDDAKISYGEIPLVQENTTKLYKALLEYVKFPFPDIEKSQQLTAPIFPFDVEFTIDGINGLRYGDVLTFEGLPEKYKKNTVFSIIGITHDVDTDGVWTSKVKCIMRPKIG